MQSARFHSAADSLHSEPSTARGLPWLSTVTYRSRAVELMSDDELRHLVEVAQLRNRAAGVTGLVVYDAGHFFQWLEGPEEGLTRIWDSVRRDPRHTDIELLNNRPTQIRFFGDWDLRLSTLSDANRRDGVAHRAFDLAPGLIDNLYLQPDAAMQLLAALGTTPLVRARSSRPAESDPARRARAGSALMAPSTSKPVLLSLVKAVVIPQLAASFTSVARAAPPVDLRAPELARLLIGTDARAVSELVGERYAQAGSIAPLCASLLEPAARLLGDLWYDDDCSEFDVTLGLGRLQTVLHEISNGALRGASALAPAVLVAPQPGETHMLGAVLDAEVLWQAGWDSHAEFPATDERLEHMLSKTWFDVLDLSLSTAFEREDWLPRMTRTIVQARNASRNPALVVVAGGRAFVGRSDAGVQVGADASNASAMQIVAVLTRALRNRT